MNGYTGKAWKNREALPYWVCTAVPYLEPYFGSVSGMWSNIEHMRFYRGCGTLADVAYVLGSRKELDLLCAPNVSYDEYESYLCQCVLRRENAHYLITPDGVIEYRLTQKKHGS